MNTTTAPKTHTCGIDCTLESTPTGGRAHIMFSSAPNRSAGRYQAEQNLGMTRKQYRESGQDETRNCRVWAANRNWEISLRAAVRFQDLSDVIIVPASATTTRSIRRHLGDDDTWIGDGLDRAIAVVERVATVELSATQGGMTFSAIENRTWGEDRI